MTVSQIEWNDINKRKTKEIIWLQEHLKQKQKFFDNKNIMTKNNLKKDNDNMKNIIIISQNNYNDNQYDSQSDNQLFPIMVQMTIIISMMIYIKTILDNMYRIWKQ